MIAAVNGIAYGGGFETALACDIILAGEHARFGLPEPKVGLAALAGGLLRLLAAIGIKRAMPRILTGRVVTVMRSSPDYLEGPRAFAEKRPPRWSVR